MSKTEVFQPSHYKVKRLGKLMNKKPDIIKSHINEWLKTSECPFTTVLHILQTPIKDQDYLNFICKTLAKNLRSYKNEGITANEEVKIQVIDIIEKFSSKNRKLLVKAFSLNTLDIVLAKAVARKHSDKDNFKTFFVYHALFELHDNEFIDSIFVPVFSRSRYKTLYEVAISSKSIQVSLIEIVDRLIIDNYSDSNAVKPCKLFEHLVDFATESQKRFPSAYSEASLVNTEEFLRTLNEKAIVNRTFREIRFLLEQWKGENISGSSLESLVLRFIGNDSGLLEGVACLVENEFKDRKRADLLRQSLQPGSERTPIWSDDEEIPIKDHELKLAIPIEICLLLTQKKN